MKKLTLDMIVQPLPIKISSGLSMGSLNYFLRWKEDYNFDYDVYLPSKGINLQRGFVWTLLQKQELIKSIIKENTIAPISVISYEEKGDKLSGKRTFKIIDGKQRLSTMFSFLNNEFALQINGEVYFFDDLDEKLQNKILHFYPTFNVVYEYWDDVISDDVKIAWFERLNFAGTPQDVEHLNKLKS